MNDGSVERGPRRTPRGRRRPLHVEGAFVSLDRSSRATAAGRMEASRRRAARPKASASDPAASASSRRSTSSRCSGGTAASTSAIRAAWRGPMSPSCSARAVPAWSPTALPASTWRCTSPGVSCCSSARWRWCSRTTGPLAPPFCRDNTRSWDAAAARARTPSRRTSTDAQRTEPAPRRPPPATPGARPRTRRHQVATHGPHRKGTAHRVSTAAAVTDARCSSSRRRAHAAGR